MRYYLRSAQTAFAFRARPPPRCFTLLGHHHLRHIQTSQLPICVARGAFVITQTGHSARPVAPQQLVGHFCAPVHVSHICRHLLVLYQLGLVGCDQQPIGRFHLRPQLSFLDPFNVRLEEQKSFLVHGESDFLQTAAFDQVQKCIQPD